MPGEHGDGGGKHVEELGDADATESHPKSESTAALQKDVVAVVERSLNGELVVEAVEEDVELDAVAGVVLNAGLVASLGMAGVGAERSGVVGLGPGGVGDGLGLVEEAVAGLLASGAMRGDAFPVEDEGSVAEGETTAEGQGSVLPRPRRFRVAIITALAESHQIVLNPHSRPLSRRRVGRRCTW